MPPGVGTADPTVLPVRYTMDRVVSGTDWPSACSVAAKAARYPTVTSRAPVRPTARRWGWPTTHTTRGHTWRQLGSNRRANHERIGGTSSTSPATAATTAIVITITSEGNCRNGPAVPRNNARVTTSRTVATNCANCHRRSEEHTSEFQSRGHLVCRLLLEKK